MTQRVLAIVSVAFLAAAVDAEPQSRSAVQKLEASRPLTGEIDAGGAYTAVITAAEGELVRVRLEWSGPGVDLHLFDPHGELLAQAQPSPDGQTDSVQWVSLEAGTYTLRVRSDSNKPPMEAGRFSLRLDERRPASAEESRR